MKNPMTSYADLIAFVEQLADQRLSTELTNEPTPQAEIQWADCWIKFAREITGETHDRNNQAHTLTKK